MGNLRNLTILHSNDLHGDFLAEKIDDKLVGGVSMLSGYVSKVRQENPNTIYCVAGDMFRGSVIDSEYLGLSTIEIMNMLAPDVACVGNHEVDYGLAHLLFIEKCANFPIINANMYIRTNHARLFRSHFIKKVGDVRVLFIGILTEEVLAKTRVSDGMIGTIVDIAEAAGEVERICNSYNSIDIDLTILLTHIGFEEDKKLAEKLDPSLSVDIIIGGHSHTLPSEPAYVNGILIVQAGVGTDQIGRFDITVDKDINRVKYYQWKSVEINAENCPHDRPLEKLINHYKKETDKKYNRVITRFVRELTHPSRIEETPIGNLFADALREPLGVDVFMMASGSIRRNNLGPIMMYMDFVETFPFDDAAWTFNVTGAQFRQMIRYMLRDEVWNGVHTEFYQMSEGVRIKYDRASGELLEFAYYGEEIASDRIFRIGMQDYHFRNFERIFSIPFSEVEKNGAPRRIATSCAEILEEYLSNHHLLDPKAEGRIEII